MLSVFGGKITTYRHLAEEAVDRLARRLPVLDAPAWTGDAPLPGGDFPLDGVSGLATALAAAAPFLKPEWVTRLVHCHGTEAQGLFAGCATLGDCGRHFGHGLTERELCHMIEREWARTAEDVLWRRTKLGLRFSAEEAQALARWMEGEAG